MPKGIYPHKPNQGFKKGNKIWNNPKTKKQYFEKGQQGYWLGKKRTTPPWNKGKNFIHSKSFKKGHIVPIEIREKISKANRISLAGKNRGNKNPMWKGGITPMNHRERTTSEYKLWVKSVFIRDGFTCQKYKTKGGNLITHHINNFSEFPELRYAIDNGITLSEKAHTEFHKIYGRKNNTKEQLTEFLCHA